MGRELKDIRNIPDTVLIAMLMEIVQELKYRLECTRALKDAAKDKKG